MYYFLVVAVCIILIIFIPGLMTRAAVAAIIKIFREQNAITVKNAKTNIELGIKKQTFVERLGKRRDYKPQALEMLIQAKIVDVTNDGRLYLREDRLATTKWAEKQ